MLVLSAASMRRKRHENVMGSGLIVINRIRYHFPFVALLMALL
jgi:hypothetical protein